MKGGLTLSEIVLTSEAAYILEVAAATVHELERRGLLAATRTAHGVRLFRREDVERLAAERRAAAIREKRTT